MNVGICNGSTVQVALDLDVHCFGEDNAAAEIVVIASTEDVAAHNHLSGQSAGAVDQSGIRRCSRVNVLSDENASHIAKNEATGISVVTSINAAADLHGGRFS